MRELICTSCGKIHKKAVMSCSSCGGAVEKYTGKHSIERESAIKSTNVEFVDISNFNVEEEERYELTEPQLNELFGGGLTKGSVTLFSGDPGNGKSTLFTQLSSMIDVKGKIAYFSGEESEHQSLQRFIRIGNQDNLKKNVLLKYSGDLDEILSSIEKLDIEVLFIDSVQTLQSKDASGIAGSISQVRHCTSEIIDACKRKGITLMMAVQVTKGGEMAGPKTLDHAGDTSIFIQKEEFEGKQIRLLKVNKNRFGSTDVVVTAEMTEKGLKFISQKEASELFITNSDIAEGDYGYCFSAIMEGSSPFFVEVQAIAEQSVYEGVPTRRANGYSLDRLYQTIAVLEKYGLGLGGTGVIINVVGKQGVANSESLDLAVAIALISAKNKKVIGQKLLVYGEIGLRGEIRNVKSKDVIEKFAKDSSFDKVISKTNNYSHIKSIIETFDPS